ncbi:MAG: flagellar basal body P-ring protein FlgI, partial [Phycisphaerae bacterium]|nr:flagellar basal body P-ring protein FlgI [Phycisphaerae bacterium]
MPGKNLLLFAAAVLVVAAIGGCLRKDTEAITPKAPPPMHIADTVAEYVVLSGGGSLPVKGYGLIIGLGKSGSKEVPVSLKKHFKEYLLKQKLSSYIYGTADVSPEKVLSDLDTAVVSVHGVVPASAPVGTRFDVSLSALPQTQTTSLDGGVLIPTEMYLAAEIADVSRTHLKSWATAEGA